jgi:hypothetical protein
VSHEFTRAAGAAAGAQRAGSEGRTAHELVQGKGGQVLLRVRILLFCAHVCCALRCWWEFLYAFLYRSLVWGLGGCAQNGARAVSQFTKVARRALKL